MTETETDKARERRMGRGEIGHAHCAEIEENRQRGRERHTQIQK